MPISRRDAAQAAVDRSTRVKYRRIRYCDNREPSTIPGARILQGLEILCWCGGAYCHDWPGKADGTPHPRDGR